MLEIGHGDARELARPGKRDASKNGLDASQASSRWAMHPSDNSLRSDDEGLERECCKGRGPVPLSTPPGPLDALQHRASHGPGRGRTWRGGGGGPRGHAAPVSGSQRRGPEGLVQGRKLTYQSLAKVPDTRADLAGKGRCGLQVRPASVAHASPGNMAP